MRKSGINSKTPEDFLLGAGTVYKNFKYVYSKVETEEGNAQPKGSFKVVADTEEETADTIRIGKLTPGVSFIGIAEGFVPKVGDFVAGAWFDTEEHVLGATSGGNKCSIVSEFSDIEVDGASVKVKGLSLKMGEAGSLETNLAQHTKESFKRAIVGKEVDSLIKGYSQIVTKPLLELSDYLDNIAFVGNKTDGTDIIIIMENVLCTSGLEIEGKNKETSVVKALFECSADFEGDVFDTLPIYIFYPEKAEA